MNEWFTGWNNPLVFENNNFINNQISVLSQAPVGSDIAVEMDNNHWGNTPIEDQIVFERDQTEAAAVVTTNDPVPTLILEDSDGDGIPDWQEIVIFGTDPNNADSSGDGIPDGFAVANGLDPNVNYQTNPELLPPGTDLADFIPDYSFTDRADRIANWYVQARGEAAAARLGDASGDGVRDNVDALIITGIVVGAPGFDVNKFNFNDMDVNLDGLVNNLDAIALINFFLGNLAVLPVPPAE